MNGAKLNTMDKEAYAKYHRAEQKVQALKGFFRHILVFVSFTLCFLAGRFYFLPMLGLIPQDDDNLNWLDWNTYLLPGLWAVVVVIHGLWAYNFRFNSIKNWEQRKLIEFLEQEDFSSNSNNSYS